MNALDILLSSGAADFPLVSQKMTAVPSRVPTVALTTVELAVEPSKHALRGTKKIAHSDPHAALPQGSDRLGMGTVLLVMASNRPDYLEKSLSYILQYHPRQAVPIVISQDGDHVAVNAVVAAFLQAFQAIAKVPAKHMHHVGQGHYENGYFALADHFKWALTEVFSDSSVQRVIILEEDLQIAPDFFEFFAAAMPLLDEDSNLMAVSAWNDNGLGALVQDSKQLYRSDFFPGLGWMLPRRIWEELAPKWPKAYWDDWLREPKQRQGRQFIRPEVCRTLHYGHRGVSNAQYSAYLTSIKLNDKFTPFTTFDLSYLRQPVWDDSYLTQVGNAPIVSPREVSNSGRSEVRVVYSTLDSSRDSFAQLARELGVMDNIKAGVPRTAYKGIVSFWSGNVKVHITPNHL